MRQKDKLRIESLGCILSNGKSLTAKPCASSLERDASGPATVANGPLNSRHSSLLRRRLVACLVGSLLLLLAVAATPTPSSAQMAIGVSVSFGPPALPVYVQPPCPGPGYIWAPGYWAWDPDYGYYWVPGTWVPAPFVGALWTPGYWGYREGLYVWYPGYWGTVVGFYGGIDYGYGYPGFGYEGGYWRRDRFFYNRAVNNIRTTNITNVYNRTVINNVNVTRVSYNGGPGGTNARATRAQLAATRGRRFGPVKEQTDQARLAQRNPMQRAAVNHGRPEIAATARPGAFHGPAAVRASRAGAPYHEPPIRTPNGRRNAQPAPGRTASPNSRRERGPATAPRQQPTPRAPVERSAPGRHENARPMEQRNTTRAQRPAPGHHENARPMEQRNTTRAQRPQPRQARPQPQPRAPREQPAQPERGNDRNGHGPGGHLQ
jgi:WXXGXW repeat (2 copies)